MFNGIGNHASNLIIGQWYGMVGDRCFDDGPNGRAAAGARRHRNPATIERLFSSLKESLSSAVGTIVGCLERAYSTTRFFPTTGPLCAILATWEKLTRLELQFSWNET